MEYAYALVMPSGCEKGIGIEVLKFLIKEGFESGLTTLVCVYDLNDKDIDKLYQKTDNILFCDNLKKRCSDKSIMPIFVKGVNAVSKLRQVADMYNNVDSNANIDKNVRYLDNIYVSKDTKEAIDDFCDYTGIADFTKIESEIFLKEDMGQIIGFNFKVLEEKSVSKQEKIIN